MEYLVLCFFCQHQEKKTSSSSSSSASATNDAVSTSASAKRDTAMASTSGGTKRTKVRHLPLSKSIYLFLRYKVCNSSWVQYTISV